MQGPLVGYQEFKVKIPNLAAHTMVGLHVMVSPTPAQAISWAWYQGVC